jgi:hypothetical protein
VKLVRSLSNDVVIIEDDGVERAGTVVVVVCCAKTIEPKKDNTLFIFI